MIAKLRERFNQEFTPGKYAALLGLLEERCGARVEFRVSESPIFVPAPVLHQMAEEGEALAQSLIGNPAYLEAARQAIPSGYRIANETPHPNFLTADFALVADVGGELAPRLVEIQAFPSVFGYQAVLGSDYREVFGLPATLSRFLSGLNEGEYWELLARTVMGNHKPENVVLTEVDPLHRF